ncbi:hypothetical protein Tco_1161494, partial [Tanacetum coccineum]
QPSTPPAPPLPATEDPAAVVIKLEALDSFLKKFHALEKDVQESSLRISKVSLKRNHEEDKDEDARPNQGKELKKRRTGKEAGSSKKFSTTKESTKGKPQSTSSKTGTSASGDQSVKEPEHEMVQAIKPPLTFEELMITPIDFSAFAMNRLLIDNITREVLVGPVFNLHKGTCKSYVKLEYNMEECYQALIDQLDWTNPEGHLPENKERSHSSSITKALAARYTIESIEDMILILWSQVEKKQGYGYLKEFVIRRADQNLYKIKEGDFLDLHLNDIEDMLLLIAQNKLCNLDGDVIVDFVIALKPFN